MKFGWPHLASMLLDAYCKNHIHKPGTTQRGPFMNERFDIMVIIAHPDDAEFGAAGSVARWVRDGKSVIYVVCTNGEKGTSDRSVTTDGTVQDSTAGTAAGGPAISASERWSFWACPISRWRRRRCFARPSCG